MIKFPLILMALCSPAALGCSWQRSNGTHRHLVLGIGLVDVDQSSGQASTGEGVDAAAVRLRAVGAMVGSGPGISGLGIGVIEHQSIEVAPDANLLLDWGPPADGDHDAPPRLRVQRIK